MKNFLIVTIMFLVSGCAMTLPVQGDFNKGQEKFLGQATGYANGNGTLIIGTESGINCSGTFKYDNPRVSGAGTVECDDGRTGTFKFTSSGTSGIGFGKTNKGEPFKFTFGHTAHVSSW